jgi:hypothetical protein
MSDQNIDILLQQFRCFIFFSQETIFFAFCSFFHVASLLSIGVDNGKVGVDNGKVGVDNEKVRVDNEKALELDNRIFFSYFSLI